MFRQGQEIVYPMHGVGVIEKIEDGKYYIIRIPNGSVRIRIPKERTREMGIRPLMKREEVEQSLKATGTGTTISSDNWNLRYKENLERLRSGKLEQAAEVVKVLTERERKKKLSIAEGRLLGMARQIVLSEVISVYEINGERAEELLANWMEIG